MIPRVPHPRPFFNPAAVFLLLGLLSGVAYCIFIPYGAGFDEEQHLTRILGLSAYHWLPNSTPPGGESIFPDVLSRSYQRRYFLEPAGDMLGSEFSQHNDHDNIFVFPTRSIYNPLMFLPQALIARWFWWKYDYPFIPVVILCRFAGLFIYLAGSYLAVRIIPVGKWIMAALALSPMAMYQAATLNTDGFTNASSFLFIAFSLEFMLNPGLPTHTSNTSTSTSHIRAATILLRIRRSGGWKIWGLAGAILLLGISKTGGLLLLPLLFFLPYRQFSNRKWPWIIVVSALLALAISVGWSILSIPSSHYGQAENSQNFGAQSSLLFSHAWDFLASFVKEISANIGLYYRNWLASYGHWVGIVPEAVYWLYPLVLICALALEPPHPEFTLRRRFILAGISLSATLLTELFFFGLFYTPGITGNFGRQGRYFITTIPLLLLAFSAAGIPRSFPEKWLRASTIGFIALASALYALGLYATYYTYCGSSIYTFKACQQPVYKNLEINKAPRVPVHTGSLVTQTFLSQCGQINAVLVYVMEVPASSAGTLTISLYDQDDGLLASRDLPLSDLQPRAYVKILVGTLAHPSGSFYRIQLQSKDISPADPLTFIAGTKDEYSIGKLAINGIEQPSDLIFKYQCEGYWQKIIQ